jgi:predicted CDP-diglyceride synthetase/phosphatidate cytidylyltransferase
MIYSVPVAGYLLVILIIMFGGRKRRTFRQASHATAGSVLTLFYLSAILWFLSVIILQLLSAEH